MNCRPWSAGHWNSLGGGSGNAGTRPERRPRCQDRDGRHDAAPRLPGIGLKAINPLTVFEITGKPRKSDRCSHRRTDHSGDCRRGSLRASPPRDRLVTPALLHRSHLRSSPLNPRDRLATPPRLQRAHHRSPPLQPSRPPRDPGPASSISPPFSPTQPPRDRLATPALLHRSHLRSPPLNPLATASRPRPCFIDLTSPDLIALAAQRPRPHHLPPRGLGSRHRCPATSSGSGRRRSRALGRRSGLRRAAAPLTDPAK